MTLDSLSPVANHLWQSTVFACGAGLLTLALRKNAARVRHRIWVVASLKFLVPFSLLIALGTHVPWRQAAGPAAVSFPIVIDQVSSPFAGPTSSFPVSSVTPHSGLLPTVLWALWACGFLLVAFSSWRRWRRVAAAVRAGAPVEAGVTIPAVSSPSFLEPGVFGVFRPVLLLPDGILEQLTHEQWQSVTAHELCHVRHRDNLIGVVQMFVEAVFWFHPLVWWLGKRICDERERGCDEEVLQMGSDPRIYAQGILKICELYLESPVACVAGISGSNLRKRIEEIVKNPGRHRLSLGSKFLLAVAGLVAAAGPFVLGIIDAPALRGQPGTVAAPKYEVAVIRPAKDDGEVGFDTQKGRFLAHNVSMKALVSRAFALDNQFISGGPKWVNSDTWDIDAKFPDGLVQPTSDQGRLMLQNLLADRFQLAIHREPGEISGYALVVAKSGPKMEHADPDLQGIKMRSPKNGQIIAQNVTMPVLAENLNRFAGSPVIDKTGLSGFFKFELDWAPEPPPSSPAASADDRPPFFVAVQQQLGLRLESTKIPISAIVIDHVEKPSEN